MMSELRFAGVALDTDHRPCLRQEELDEHSEDDEDEEEDVSQNTPSLHVVAGTARLFRTEKTRKKTRTRRWPSCDSNKNCLIKKFAICSRLSIGSRPRFRVSAV